MTMTESIAEIVRLTREKLVLLDTLRLWAELAEQGITETEGLAFGWDEEIAAPLRHRANLKAASGKPGGEWAGKYPVAHYNYVRMPDGTKRTLSPFLRVPG